MYIQIIKLGICIGKILLNIIYFFIKLCPTKNKIVMLSRQHDKTSMDFELIKKEITNRDTNIKTEILCKTIKKGLKNKIIYCFYILKCMYHIATSKVCIIDGYSIPISILKHKKHLIVIQIWHASGAIKKFGYQILEQKEGRKSEIAKAMNMHKNYSYVMAPSKETAKFYSEAFKIEKNKIFINSLPRIDYLLDKSLTEEKIKEFYKQYPTYKNKKTILYVPTFRKNNDCTEIINKIVECIDFKKYNLIIKLHPLDITPDKELYTVDKKYDTYDLLKIADYVITDYSSIAFEASLLKKQLYFYMYDIEDYTEKRGLNFNIFKEMSSSTKNNINEIIELIENEQYDYKQLENFKVKYMGDDNSNSTSKLIDFIFNILN